jgi:branched-chain amino acid transport system permease protein
VLAGIFVDLLLFIFSFEGGWPLFSRQLVNAFTMGGIYALIAVGYTMVYGIVKLVNFAHGEIYMFGAFFGVLLISAGVPFGPALAVAMIGCAGLGFLIDQLAYRPLRSAPRLASLITAIGMSLFLQNLAMLLFSAEQRPFPELRPDYRITVEAKGWPEDALRERVLEPSRKAWEALRSGRWDAVPFLSDYQRAVRRLEDDTILPEERARVERQRKEAVARLPVLKGWEVEGSGVEGGSGVRLSVRFRTGSNVTDVNKLLNDWRQWTRGLPRPEGADRLEIVHEKQKHPFEQDLSVRGLPPLSIKILFIWGVTILLMGVLHGVVQYTRLGKAMRACSQDRVTSALMGIPVNRVITCTFMIGSAMAAVAGILYGLYLGSGIYYRMGYFAGVLAFAAAVLGGIGNLKGAMLGGMLLGFTQGISKAYITEWLTEWIRRGAAQWLVFRHGVEGAARVLEDFKYSVNSSYDYAFAFGILILVILLRPRGLLGSAEVDRA